MINYDQIHDVFLKLGYDDSCTYDMIDDFVVDKLCTNTYVRVQKSKSGDVTWRPYIEPINFVGGFEFNYVYKDRWRALWAALVAAAVFRLNRKEDPDTILDVVMRTWKLCELKPDFKITINQPKQETSHESPGTEKLNKTFSDLFGNGISNPFAQFGL